MFTNLTQLVKNDLYRYGKKTGLRGFFVVYLVHPGFRVTFWYRLTRFFKNSKFPAVFSKFSILCLLRQQTLTGVTLNPGTEIGPGLYIPHPGCVVINPCCKIGKNLYLSHDVLLGKVHLGPKKGVPVIGDNVYIGAGARLLGNLKVGHNAAIGVNSVVLKDVAENTFVVGSPARLVKNEGADHLLGDDAHLPPENV